VTIPAPQSSIFLADGQTINLASTGIITLVAACVGTLESISGSLAVSVIAGVRRRRRDLFP
jgi:hypothetical protein